MRSWRLELLRAIQNHHNLSPAPLFKCGRAFFLRLKSKREYRPDQRVQQPASAESSNWHTQLDGSISLSASPLPHQLSISSRDIPLRAPAASQRSSRPCMSSVSWLATLSMDASP